MARRISNLPPQTVLATRISSALDFRAEIDDYLKQSYSVIPSRCAAIAEGRLRSWAKLVFVVATLRQWAFERSLDEIALHCQVRYGAAHRSGAEASGSRSLGAFATLQMVHRSPARCGLGALHVQSNRLRVNRRQTNRVKNG